MGNSKKIKTESDLKNKPKQKVILFLFVILILVIVYKFFGWVSDQNKIKENKALKQSKNIISVTDESIISLDKQAAIENKINAVKKKNKDLKVSLEELKLKDKNREHEIDELKKISSKLLEELSNSRTLEKDKMTNQSRQFRQVQEDLKKEINSLRKEVKQKVQYDGIELPELKLPVIKENETRDNNSEENKVFDEVRSKPKEEKEAKGEETYFSFFSMGKDDNESIIENRNNKEKKVEQKEQKVEPPKHMLRIGFLNAISMTGVKVPVSSSGIGTSSASDTYPMFFKLGGKSIVSNSFSQDLKNCIALGSAKGNGNSDRAMIHVIKISCTDPTGRYRYEASTEKNGVNAYIVGEDNILGMHGKREDVSASFLYKSLMAGFMQGVANAFSSVPKVLGGGTNSIATTGGGGGFGSGFSQGASQSLSSLAKYYIGLAKTILPVISVKAGRRVTIAIASDSEFEPVEFKSVFVNTPFEYKASKEFIDSFEAVKLDLEG